MKSQFYLYRAEAYYNMNQANEAFEQFEKVIELEPDNYVAMNNYAYYLSVRGEQLDKAEKLSSKAIQAHPNNPTYLDTYAWVLFKKKDYNLAKFYMKTALGQTIKLVNPLCLKHYGDILFQLGDFEEAPELLEKITGKRQCIRIVEKENKRRKVYRRVKNG